MTENSSSYIDSMLSAEEATRQWWLQTYGTPLPGEVRNWLHDIIRREVERSRLSEHHLDDAALNKVRDGRRLCLTRLEHTETEITDTRIQEALLRRFLRVNSELAKHQKHLYELNKQQAQVLTRQREMERYQSFEAVNGRFQRINTLNEAIAVSRQRQSELGANLDNTQRAADEAEKRMAIEKAKIKEAEEALSNAATTLADSLRLTAEVAATTDHHDDILLQQKQIQERIDILGSLKKENQSLREQVNAQLEQFRLQRQTLEAHANLIEHAEGTQVRLKELKESMALRDGLEEQLSQAITKNNERNAQLGRLFTQSQQIEEGIQALREEVRGHRSNIAGQDSYTLQRRVTELHGRGLMLMTGASLWRSIATGYDLLDEKRQQVASLRLKTDHLSRNIDALEAEVRKLLKQQDVKAEQLFVAKSQNIIELREGLKEGEPCMVCGASHHPWHSESIAEQNSLIASLKWDYELTTKELANKRKELNALQMDMATVKGQLESEQGHIDFIRHRQEKDTEEWRFFSQLDRSFTECSPSTNREARSAMIQQLIDKNKVELEEAEKELSAFNYHMDAISNLSSQIQQRQQEANDLSLRLNEVNTACQVMAGQVERFTVRLNIANQDFSRRYDELDKLITLPEWFAQWKTSPESINLRIQEFASQWKKVNKEIQNLEASRHALEVNAEQLEKFASMLQVELQGNETNFSKLSERLEATRHELQKVLEGRDMKAFYAEKRQALAAQLEEHGKMLEAFVQAISEHLALKSQILNLEETTHQTEARLAHERRELDLWMQHYNASHPPVQMSELERLLADGQAWDAVRESVKTLTEDFAVTQARVDYLRADIIAMQADGLTPFDGDGSKETETLHHQLEALEAQRTQILQQLGRYEEMLRSHELTLHQNA